MLRHFKNSKVSQLFFLENVLSPEGRCVVYPVGVQLILFPFIVLVNVYCTFKNRLGFLRFLNLENVLSPEGRYVLYAVGVQ